MRISIYNAGKVAYAVGMLELDDELVGEILDRNRVLNERLCMMGGVPDLPETKEKLVASLRQSEAMMQGYWQSLDAADRQLFDAYEIRDVEGMRVALRTGANPDLRLLWDGERLVVDAVESVWADGAALLLEAGANPLMDGGRLLTQLCFYGPAELFQHVLELPGVSPDFSDGSDTLAVLAAEWGRVDCLRVLRAAGADLLADDGRALCRACAMNQPEVVRYLLEECGAPLELEYDDWTPLAHAALHDSMECARILLEAGANPEHPGITGRTPLDRAESERMRQMLDGYCR